MGTSMGSQPQKTQRSQKMFWYITLCREFYADHFSSFCFLVSSRNGGGKVKILKTIKWFWPAFFSSFFSLFWPYHRYLLMKVEIFFHQNDQQDELYKLEYAKKKMTKFCFFKRWIVMWIKSIAINSTWLYYSNVWHSEFCSPESALQNPICDIPNTV